MCSDSRNSNVSTIAMAMAIADLQYVFFFRLICNFWCAKQMVAFWCIVKLFLSFPVPFSVAIVLVGLADSTAFAPKDSDNIFVVVVSPNYQMIGENNEEERERESDHESHAE